MNKLIIYVALIALCCIAKLQAQETFEQKAKAIAYRIEKISKEEKQLLKEQVEIVNQELEKGVLTRNQADDKKLQLAQNSASKIESRVAFEEANLTALIKEKVEGRIAVLDTSETKKHVFYINFKTKKDTITKSEKRTTSQFVFAAGINNLVTNGSVANSDYRYWGSHFYEWGLTFNTRILKNNNLLHFKYGLSVQYNNLRPTDNRFFEESGDQTLLQQSSVSLDESRLRNVNLTLPLYLEFDASPKKVKNGKDFFKIQQSFRFGIGGFIGTNLKTKQVLEYQSVSGSVTSKTIGSYNVTDFVYGLGTYIGYRDTSLYVKYDLNPLFKNNLVEQKNISLGIRFDLN